jgi:hypothetical protein
MQIYLACTIYMNPDGDIVNSIPDPYFAIKREKRQELTVRASYANCSDLLRIYASKCLTMY